MGAWGAVALPRVSQPEIAAVLESMGRTWESVEHVTATTTLSAAIRKTEVLALPVATLVDLLVMPGMPSSFELTLDTFPGPNVFAASRSDYADQVGAWQDQASARRLRMGIRVDDLLRQFVREEADNVTGRALVSSRREYARTVHALVNAGVNPRGLVARDHLGQVAARAWAHAEDEEPALGRPRELLWVNHEDLKTDATPDAREVAGRVRSLLRAAFGDNERWTLVHHGFYFYTPPQWAMFQLLRQIDEVDQVFVIHDDGTNPAFSSWRHYFRNELDMPVPVLAPGSEDVTSAAAAFRGMLAGKPEGDVSALQVRECRSATELVRLWQQEQEQDRAEGRAEGREPGPDEGTAPVRYAAAAKEVQRLVQRLGRTDEVARPRLADLPVGSFLMSLHGCISQATDGRTSVNLDGSDLLDIVGSGFLDVPATPRASVLRRVLPYFEDCRTSVAWVERASLLTRTIRDRVSPLGARADGVSDVERFRVAASNASRLAPWADLTLDEAIAVERSVRRVIDLVEEITARERITLGDHLERVQAQLRRALAKADESERAKLENKLRGFSVALEDEIDVAGLVDVVAMLLGRSAEQLADADQEDPTLGGTASVQELRGLDALGLVRRDQDLHLANLAEDVFPSRGASVGWPFDLEDLEQSGDDAVEPVTVDLFAVRGSTGALGDLYLFWLALDGAEPGRSVTLSWQSDVAGNRRRLSPLVTLLTVPDLRSEAVRAVAGGITVGVVASAADRQAEATKPSPRDLEAADNALDAVVNALDKRSIAAAEACPRRFAIQWALGPSAAFGADFLQTMLFGNLAGALVKTKQENQLGALATANDLWPQLTEGQRQSSRAKSTVKPGGARPEWVFTLNGNQNGSKPFDRAYQAAYGAMGIDGEDIAPAGTAFLPLGTDDPDVCKMCPVQARCSQRKTSQK